VTALINDTVGVLVAHAYSDPKARIGFIYGTGVNAAYPEKISKMVKLGSDYKQHHDDEDMLVNTEIDIFGSEAYLPLNQYDRTMDANHNQPEFQLYEKMMSGAYLGELVRLAALDLIQENALFDGHLPLEFKSMYSFETAQLSDLERWVRGLEGWVMITNS
jgi:hexokinase